MEDNKNFDKYVENAFSKLSLVQKDELNKQIERFKGLQNLTMASNGPNVDSSGKVLLKEGLLIHGIGSFTREKIESISQSGILGRVFIGEKETKENDYCANFYRVFSDVTLEEYNRRFIYSDDLFDKMPFSQKKRPRGERNVAFIISPIKEANELLSYDQYRVDIEAGSITRSFRNNRIFSALDYNKEVSILYGIPSSLFNGIILGDALIEDVEIINFMIGLFPNCYIVSKTGDIIYGGSLDIIKREEFELKAMNESLKRENDKLQKEKEFVVLQSEKMFRENEVLRTYLIDKICLYSPLDVAIKELEAIGFNDSHDKLVKFIVNRRNVFSSYGSQKKSTKSKR